MALAFNDLGMDVFPVEKDDDFEKAKLKINKDFAVVFVTETIAEKYNLDDFYSETLPALLVIPGVKSTGKGLASLKKTIERALGSELNI